MNEKLLALKGNVIRTNFTNISIAKLLELLLKSDY
jgi:hypothetical protein